MNAADLRTLDDAALLARRQDLLGQLTSLKFQQATGQLENTASVTAARRAFARVNTIVRQRELEQDLPQGGLSQKVGKLDPESSAFASFRKLMGQQAN